MLIAFHDLDTSSLEYITSYGGVTIKARSHSGQYVLIPFVRGSVMALHLLAFKEDIPLAEWLPV